MLVAAVAGVGFTASAQALNDKVLNRPYADMRRWHLGFSVGVHTQDVTFVHNGFVTEQGEQWYMEQPSFSPGFLRQRPHRPAAQLSVQPPLHSGHVFRQPRHHNARISDRRGAETKCQVDLYRAPRRPEILRHALSPVAPLHHRRSDAVDQSHPQQRRLSPCQAFRHVSDCRIRLRLLSALFQIHTRSEILLRPLRYNRPRPPRPGGRA